MSLTPSTSSSTSLSTALSLIVSKSLTPSTASSTSLIEVSLKSLAAATLSKQNNAIVNKKIIITLFLFIAPLPYILDKKIILPVNTLSKKIDKFIGKIIFSLNLLIPYFYYSTLVVK